MLVFFELEDGWIEVEVEFWCCERGDGFVELWIFCDE